MNPSEQVPVDEWTALDHLWEDLAEAWFRPDGDRPTYRFRVPGDRFPTAEAGPSLTVQTLLEAAALPADEVESWRVGDAPDAAGTSADLNHSLPPPPAGATHLTVYVQMKPAAAGGGAPDVSPEQWQALDALWKAVLGLEAAIDSLRMSADGLRSEMEGAFKKSLGVEDKVHALQIDVVQWTKAKSRVHFALPKVREFIHRATWASAASERKRLEEVVETYIAPRVPPPDLNHVRERLEHLQKDRQVLYVQGNAVAQECRVILAEIQRALGTLQRNAADRARKEREARRTKGKYL